MDEPTNMPGGEEQKPMDEPMAAPTPEVPAEEPKPEEPMAPPAE